MPLDNRGGRRSRAGRNRVPEPVVTNLADIAPETDITAVVASGREFPSHLVEDVSPLPPDRPLTVEAAERQRQLMAAIYTAAKFGTSWRGRGVDGAGVDWQKPLLPQLSPNQQLAAALAVRGVSGRAISRQLNMSEATIQEWHHSVWWALAVKEAIEEIVQQPLSALEAMVPAALGVYADKLSQGDGKTAEDVLSRIWGKPVARVQSEEVKDIVIKFEDFDAGD